MRPWSRRAAFATTALLLACAETTTINDPVAQTEAPRSLSNDGARVASVVFRLATAGADVCPITTATSGLLLGDPPASPSTAGVPARRQSSLRDGLVVLATAPGSPADRSGLRPGDTLLAMNGLSLLTHAVDGVAAAYDILERPTAAQGVTFRYRRGAQEQDATIRPVRGCRSRVRLLPSDRVRAAANGIALTVTTGLLAYVANDDELALAVAHEMSHNALGHRAVRDAIAGASSSARAATVQRTEREADRLAYVLMARAGYDIGVAPAFWTRLHRGPRALAFRSPEYPELAVRISDYNRAVERFEAARVVGLPPTP